MSISSGNSHLGTDFIQSSQDAGVYVAVTKIMYVYKQISKFGAWASSPDQCGNGIVNTGNLAVTIDDTEIKS